jgi:hypothetical protein
VRKRLTVRVVEEVAVIPAIAWGPAIAVDPRAAAKASLLALKADPPIKTSVDGEIPVGVITVPEMVVTFPS